MSGKGILILGGARSGKSAYAQEMAQNSGLKVLFVATAEALDDDLRRRIDRHRRERPASWRTIEAPTDVASSISGNVGDAGVIIIDCLTLLVSNVILGESRRRPDVEEIDEVAAMDLVTKEAEAIIGVIQKTDATFIMVSNEVGLGLVPDNQLGRIYRDLLGSANQLIAQNADTVYFMVAGIPMKVKG